MIITTDHLEVIPRAKLTGFNTDGTEIETAAAYAMHLTSLNERAPKIKCLRRCWWQDEHTPSAVMGVFPSQSGHRHLSQVTTVAQWTANVAQLAVLDGLISANPTDVAALAPPGGQFNPSAPGGVWYQEQQGLREYFHRFPLDSSHGVLP